MRAILLAALMAAPLAAPLAAQAPVVHIGATVRARIPRLGADWMTGRFTSTTGARQCLGVRLDQPDAAGRPRMALLTGITELQVDRRTNQGVLTAALSPPTDADWEPADLAQLVVQDSLCRKR
ncbi:MAG: hypothetical protein ACOY71_04685 [Gemmatimonadota bacterium]